MKKIITNFQRVAVAFLFLAGSITATFALPVFAQSPQDGPTAKVSFTFDDGLQSSYTHVAPTLANYGLTGTNYVVTGCIGMTSAPNTCRADTQDRYMTWAQVKALQSQYGWEIGSHTVTHPYLASYDAGDGQPAPLTPEQVSREIVQSKTDLAAQGINATAFSSPYGDYSNATRQVIAKYYSSHRGFADQGDNVWPYNDTLLNNMQVQAGVTPTAVKAKIDRAIANKQWLILTFHDIKTSASQDPDEYEYSVSNLASIAAYVKQKQDAGQIKNTNITAGLITGTANMLPNGSFSQGLTAGWTTDTPAAIQADATTNGSFPQAQNSIKFTSTTKNAHLFSPKVSVNPNSTYLLRNYLNVQRISSGEIGFYVDEYDANGNWISGQYKAREPSSFVEYIDFTYKPSSVAVHAASLQVFVTANSNAVAYLDNVQWHNLSPTSSTRTNVMPNSTFDAGISNGWSTDSSSVYTSDSSNFGSPANPQHSVAIKASGTTRNSHLFSPRITVDPAKDYMLENYLNINQYTSGEVAFYIDEYDQNGNWVSGQYKQSTWGTGVKNIMMMYRASSTNVRSANLQVIVSNGSTLTAYFDDSRWWATN